MTGILIETGVHYGRTHMSIDMSQIKLQVVETFPTSLLIIDVNYLITESMREVMVRDVDGIIDRGEYLQIDDVTPRWQCKPMLWNEEKSPGPHWMALRDSFIMACGIYTQQVENFVKNQTSLEPVSVRAWFYKSYRSLNLTESNPWHNHSPSFLSGVFYLRVPGDLTTGGTEFKDPRGPVSGVRDVAVLPVIGAWVIFPGWLEHRSIRVDTEDPRYTIAADCYVRVIS